MSDWISVDEELPPKGEIVLITYGYENLLDEEYPIYCAKRVLCNNDLGYVWCSKNESIKEPKFWAFLPKPPRNEDE